MEDKKGVKPKVILEEMRKFLDKLNPARDKNPEPRQPGLFPFDLRLMVISSTEALSGKMELFCWIGWFGFEGTIVVVQASGPEGQLALYERALTLNEVEPFVDLLKVVGLPKRRPDVQHNKLYELDMAGWVSTTLRIERDIDFLETRFSYMRHAEGRDAEGIRAMFRYLLNLAAVRNESVWEFLTAK